MVKSLRGRPKKTNKKDKILKLRVDEMTINSLDYISKKLGLTRSETVRLLIRKAANII